MKKIILLISFSLLLAGCADQVSLVEAATRTEVGFWYGLWHGFILPFSWVISLFDKDVAIYAIYNTGGWYDFGFLLGILFMFGGSADSSHRVKARRV